MNNTLLAIFSITLIIVGGLVVLATRHTDVIHELACERNGVTGVTTMHELRKEGPYVILERPDGTSIAVVKDGIRCKPI